MEICFIRAKLINVRGTLMLPSKQKRVFGFAQQFLKDRGYPPTIGGIVTRCRTRFTSVVAYKLGLRVKGDSAVGALVKK